MSSGTPTKDLRPFAVAFDIVRLAVERTGALLALVLSGGVALGLVAIIGNLAEWAEMLAVPAPAIALPTALLAIPVILLFMLGMPAAWLRLSVRDEVPGNFPLRLGGDEFRMAVGIFVIHLVAGLLAMLPAVPLTIATIMVQQLMPANGDWISAGLMVITMAACFAAYTYVWARLGPSLALSLYRRKLTIFGTWHATRPIRFKLIAVWLPACVGYALLNLAVFLAGTASAAGGGDTLGVLAAVFLGSAYTLFAGWVMTIHAAVTRWLLEQNSELGAQPEA